jgi:hypothetical protein
MVQISPSRNGTKRNEIPRGSPVRSLIIKHLQRSKRNDRSIFPSQMPAVTGNLPILSEVIRTFTRAPLPWPRLPTAIFRHSSKSKMVNRNS